MQWGVCLVFPLQRGEFSIFFARNIIIAISLASYDLRMNAAAEAMGIPLSAHVR